MYKDKRTGRWYLHFYVHGKRHREATHTTDRSEAKEMLDRRLREVLSGTFAGRTSDHVTVSNLRADVVTDYEIN